MTLYGLLFNLLLLGMMVGQTARAEPFVDSFPVSQLARSGQTSPLKSGSTTPAAALKDCQSCHDIKLFQYPGMKPDHDLPLIDKPVMESDCHQCHNKNDFSKHYVQFAQVKENKTNESRKKPLDIALKKASGKGPGMGVIMYYKTSRIGDEPNKMVLIPEGEFTMGSNSRLPDEGPQHRVKLDAFLIDIYEVTNFQYKKFIDATNRRSPEHFENRTFPESKIDHPVTYVSWKDARAYCKWAGKRLPTDQEWEKAARGTDAFIYPWGDVYDTMKVNSPQRWIELKLEGDTTPVGAFESGKSPYGLYDMSGNVWEWTDSWYTAYPGNTRPSENYGQIYKTLKGGSWWDCSFYKCGISAPTYNRSFFLKSTKNKSFGFRCAKDANT